VTRVGAPIAADPPLATTTPPAGTSITSPSLRGIPSTKTGSVLLIRYLSGKGTVILADSWSPISALPPATRNGPQYAG
jgi:hypothetical protein